MNLEFPIFLEDIDTTLYNGEIKKKTTFFFQIRLNI